MHNMKKFIYTSIFFLSVFIIISSFLFDSKSPAKTPTISWNPTKINETLSPGELKSVNVSFVSSQDLNNVDVVIVPELQPYVEVSPDSFTHVNTGAQYSINLMINAPAAAVSEILDGIIVGSLQIKNTTKNRRTYARPIPIILNFWKSFTNQEGEYSILVPPDWQVRTSTAEADFTILIPPGRLPNPEREYFADLVIDSIQNPANLSFIEFYESPDRPNLFQDAQNYTFLQLNGFEAVLFEGVLGLVPRTIVSVMIEGHVVEIVDINENHQLDGIFENIVSSFIAL